MTEKEILAIIRKKIADDGINQNQFSIRTGLALETCKRFYTPERHGDPKECAILRAAMALGLLVLKTD